MGLNPLIVCINEFVSISFGVKVPLGLGTSVLGVSVIEIGVSVNGISVVVRFARSMLTLSKLKSNCHHFFLLNSHFRGFLIKLIGTIISFVIDF